MCTMRIAIVSCRPVTTCFEKQWGALRYLTNVTNILEKIRKPSKVVFLNPSNATYRFRIYEPRKYKHALFLLWAYFSSAEKNKRQFLQIKQIMSEFGILSFMKV